MDERIYCSWQCMLIGRYHWYNLPLPHMKKKGMKQLISNGHPVAGMIASIGTVQQQRNYHYDQQ